LNGALRTRPDDVAPWVTLQTIAMGLGADRDEKDRLWREISARVPDLLPAHMTRVRTLSATRGGSVEEMFASAGAATDISPEGSPLPSVLALAHAAFLRGEQKRLVAEGKSNHMAHMSLGRLQREPAQDLYAAARHCAAHAQPHARDSQAQHRFG